MIIIECSSFKNFDIANELVNEGVYFGLRTIIRVRNISSTNWIRDTFSQHGRDYFKSWWYNKKDENTPIQIVELLTETLPQNEIYTLVYIQKQSIAVHDFLNKFLKNIGDQ